jgi:hypothetical protein
MDGEPWRWKGVTAFGLLDRFAKREDIEPFLLEFAGYNVLRVFSYTPVKEWGASAWDTPDTETIRSFLAFVARYGFFVELVLLTDDDTARVAPANRLIKDLAGVATLLLEAGNEPSTHKAIVTHALRDSLESSGLLFSSGDSEHSDWFFGNYLTAHTGRDSEWPRRAHDLLEYFNGGGPNAPSDPAHRVPIVADEPIRPDQASGDRERDFLAYYGTCALLGAGATFHCESGKFGRRPNDDEQRFAAIALQGLNAFPAQAPKGPYRRIDEGPNSLRTYVVEPFSVRVRPKTNIHPEPGWRALEPSGVLWER